MRWLGSHTLGALLAVVLGTLPAYAEPRPAPVPAPRSAPIPAPKPAPALVQQTDCGVHFDVHRRDAEKLFQASGDKFKGSLDVPTLRLQVQGIAEGKPATGVDLEKLKLVRKDGNVLRSSFVLFDKKHEPPPKLDKFVTSFGKMNDAIASGNKDESAHYARKVLRALDEKGLKKEVGSFEPASHKSFEKEMDEQRLGLEASLVKKSVPAPEFHEMRKSLTKVLTILSLAPEARKDPKIEALYQKVLSVQTEMGEMHDDLTGKSMRGEIDYGKFQVVLPPHIRAGLREILDTVN